MGTVSGNSALNQMGGMGGSGPQKCASRHVSRSK